MAVVETLTPAELARQLANPDGAVGIAVADWLDQRNKEADAKTIQLLSVEAGHQVLEIGFGNGRTAALVIAQAPNVRYAGIDISPTMVAEALTLNAALVASGKASFYQASAEQAPFGNASFDRVFSIGVIHFWTEPLASLVEVRRVLRPGGLMLMACLAPKDAPDFAQLEYGFHLRDASEWDALCRKAYFVDVDVQTFEVKQTTPSGAPTKRYAILMRARA